MTNDHVTELKALSFNAKGTLCDESTAFMEQVARVAVKCDVEASPLN